MDQKFLSDTIYVFILAAAENTDGVNTKIWCKKILTL